MVAVAAMAIRFESARDALWIDEWISAWTVEDALAEVAPRAALGHASPFFYWMLWSCRQVGGDNPWALRAISLASGLGTLALIGWVVQRTTGSLSAAAAVVAIAALDQNYVFYASEARPYALVQLLGLTQILCLLNVLRRDSHGRTPALLAWAVLSVLLFALHYTTIVLLAAELTWCLFIAVAVVPDRRAASQVLCAGIAIAATLCVLAEPLGSIWRARQNWGSFVDVWSYLRSFQFSGLAYVLPLAGSLILTAIVRPPTSDAQRRGTSLRGLLPWWLAAAIAVSVWLGALVATAWFAVPIAHYRYVIGVSGLCPLLLGIAVGQHAKPIRAMASGLILVGAGIYFLTTTCDLPRRQWQRPLRYERWDMASAIIESDPARAHWPVVVFPNLIEDGQINDSLAPRERDYFLAAVPQLRGASPHERGVFPAAMQWPVRLSEPALTKIVEAGGGWLLMRGGWREDPNRPPALVVGIADSVVEVLRRRWDCRWVEIPIPDSTVYLLRVQATR